MSLQLVTHCTQAYLPRMRPYLESLGRYFPAPVRLLTVEFEAPALFMAEFPGVTFMRVPKVSGSAENTDSLQHGAFIDWVPGAETDVLVYTDGDLVMQRAMTERERYWLENLPADDVACGWNSGPGETLAIEAARLFPRLDPAGVFGEMVYHTPCYNIGVIAARRSTWRAIWQRYMTQWDMALATFGAQQRQQWLVCWAIETLDLDVQVLPYSFVLNGHYPLPAGAENRSLYVGGAATFNGEPVLFRHKL